MSDRKNCVYLVIASTKSCMKYGNGHHAFIYNAFNQFVYDGGEHVYSLKNVTTEEDRKLLMFNLSIERIKYVYGICNNVTETKIKENKFLYYEISGNNDDDHPVFIRKFVEN